MIITARMFEDCVHAEGGVLTITAKGLDWEEGKSGHDPYLPIRYHSGAIHSKNRVCVNSDWPKMEVKGEFQAPSAPGTWPAFWMVNGHGDWPPELDILEFKGDAYNWQNTFHKPHKCLIAKTRIDHPEHWHSYRAWIELKSHHNIEVHYYVDEKWIACHQAGLPYAFNNQPSNGGILRRE
jgi:beta-glucanase (GH16 family)